jgi:cell division protein FtsI/penicillin-binding protein 2
VIAPLLEKPKVYLLKRYANQDIAARIKDLHYDSLLRERVYQRYYPEGETLVHTVGFCGYEGQGFTGIEKYYNDLLLLHHVITNRVVVKLSINLALQKYIEEKLRNAIQTYDADSGIIILQKISDGCVINLAVKPEFDPNELQKQKSIDYLHPAVSEIMEPGSIMKIFFLAYLIEKYNIDIKKKYFHCEGDYTLENGEIVRCREHGDMSFETIIQKSCNSGMIQATEKLSRREILELLYRIQFGIRTGIELPNETEGVIRRVKNIGIRDKAMIPIGQGIAITPIQLISTFSALVGDGMYYMPRLVESIYTINEANQYKEHELPLRSRGRIFSDEISKASRNLLKLGTIKGSTGFRASDTGYPSAGKTGTVQQVNLDRGGYYTNRYNAMFIAAFPPDNPVVSVLIILKNPRKSHYGGTVAAPIYAGIIEEVASQLKIYIPKQTEYYTREILKIHKIKNSYRKNEVPDFRGLSFRDAMILFSQFEKKNVFSEDPISLSYNGMGYVVSQEPSSGTAVYPGMVLKLIFKDRR